VTAPETIDTALRLMQRVGQSPVHVREEVTGFLLNRLQWTLLAEACRLVAAGVVSPDAVDRALRDGLGRWAFMGPFEVGDLNAPGGLGDYLRRFRPTIETIDAANAAQPLQLDESLIAQLDADAQQRLQTRARPASPRANDVCSRSRRRYATLDLNRRR
jgi:3-hydroxyacyl-CoA dehydrogenase